MKTKRRIILPILIFLALAFIWLNSAMDSVMSDEESSRILDLLNRITEAIFNRSLTLHVVRKLAHFVEFAVLGGLFYLSVALFDTSPSLRIYISETLSLIVALIDETIQLSSDGRSSQVTDVWLDSLGSFSAILCLALLFALLHLDKGGDNTAKITDKDDGNLPE
ncbi:MAG: VanZ family protein [Firmicutes bacterium]|nr:VanZ family protein [Bacillota bacterium]